MIIESLVSSVVVGKIRKGKIKNIEKVDLKGGGLFIAALILEAGANIIAASKWHILGNFIEKYFIIIHTVSYLLIFTGIGMNYKKKSMWFVFAGTFMNFLVIITNCGHMPVWFEGLKIAGIIPKDSVRAGFDLTHSIIDNSTKLAFLADIIPLPKPYPLPKLMSMGDILLAAGVFIFIQEAMVLKSDSNSLL